MAMERVMSQMKAIMNEAHEGFGAEGFVGVASADHVGVGVVGGLGTAAAEVWVRARVADELARADRFGAEFVEASLEIAKFVEVLRKPALVPKSKALPECARLFGDDIDDGGALAAFGFLGCANGGVFTGGGEARGELFPSAT